MIEFLSVMMFFGIIGWIISAVARLYAAWDKHQLKATEVRKTFTAAGLKLANYLEMIQKLEEEAEKVRTNMVMAVQEQKDRQASYAKSVRPPPPDVYVTSEMPPSQQDLAWIATFSRVAKWAPQPWEIEPKPMLIWGHTQHAAEYRARQLVAEFKTYGVANLAPLI